MTPSWVNVQPYRVVMASGERCDEIRTALATKYRRASAVKNGSLAKKLAALLKGGVLPDGPLGTCVQGPVATWASPVCSHFHIPDGYKLVCGIAMGYGIPEPVNNYHPTRRTLD